MWRGAPIGRGRHDGGAQIADIARGAAIAEWRCVLDARHTPGLAALLMVTLLVAQEGRACPDCAAGRAARAAVFDGDFARTFAVMVTSFLVVGALSAAAWRSAGRAR